jgi:Zinc dependent phospholipase C.
MNIAKAAKTSCMAAAKFILANSEQLQTLIDDQTKPVHSYCNQAATEILAADGWKEQNRILSAYLDEINAGSAWADTGWKNVAHFYDPVTSQGLRGWNNAVEEFLGYFNLARSYMKQRHLNEAFFYLGAAVHLVQDMCVPFHSRKVVFAGHHNYEKWAENHVEDYLVFSNGIYNDNMKNPGDWITTNAQASYDLFSLVKSSSNKGYHLVTAAMLPYTQRTSAGFFHYFLQHQV